MKLLSETKIEEKIITLDSKLTLNSSNEFDYYFERNELEELLQVSEILKIKYKNYYELDRVSHYEYKVKYVRK